MIKIEEIKKMNKEERKEFLDWIGVHYLIMNYAIKENLKLLNLYKQCLQLNELSFFSRICLFLNIVDDPNLLDNTDELNKIVENLMQRDFFDFCNFEIPREFLIERFNINTKTIDKKEVILFFFNDKKSKYVLQNFTL